MLTYILYGSSTGTAEDEALRLARLLPPHLLADRVGAFDHFPLSELFRWGPGVES